MAAALKSRWERFWYEPTPLGRVAVLRIAVYLFVPIDLWLNTWVAGHGLVPGSWYAPLGIGRLLHIPGPTHLGMTIVALGIVVFCIVAATGRGRRTVGVAVVLLYSYWWYMGFSYGKVDHDKLALIVALAVLPTVDWTSVRDSTRDVRAGWVLRAVQVAVVLVYLLSAVTKLRVSGPGWVTSSILIFAIVRRGTMFADPLLDYPQLLHAMQAGILAFELTSPLLLAKGRIGRVYLAAAFGFHLVSFVGVTIHFLPQVVCLLAFLPLEVAVKRTAQVGSRLALAGRPR